MKCPKTVLLLILSLVQYVSIAQNTGILSQNLNSFTYEKVYLHTDRDFYFLGETIWFKAYLLNGQSLLPVQDIQNLYIDLIDRRGSVIRNQVLLCENGLSAGSFVIPDTIVSGTFFIRAYTDYLKNFGEEAFFHKVLKISEVKSSFELEAENLALEKGNPRIDVSFFPEGGYLLAGTLNLLAFKAIDQTGQGISIRGRVRDSNGETVSIFESQYHGMGRMYLKPEEGKFYEVEIDGYPDFEYRLFNILNEGVKLQLLDQTMEKLVFEVVSNSRQHTQQTFYLACFARDKLLFYDVIEGSFHSLKIEVETDLIYGGINRFVLLNEALEPVSERLVFSNNISINHLEIKPGEEEFATRSPVQLEIREENDTAASGYSTLSVAVVDENALNIHGENQNILSYLLLDSELKGFNESSADYFLEDDSISSQDKLNLLMLTHGWSRYLRNTFEENQEEFIYRKTAGIDIHGKAERIIGHKPIVNGHVTIGIFEDSFVNWHESRTDSTGRFTLDNLIFFDTATVFAQTLNEKGKQKSEVFIDTVVIIEQHVSPDILSALRDLQDIPLQLHRKKYVSEEEFRKLHPEDGSIWIEEVEIRETRVEPGDGHFRLYLRADQVLEISDHANAYSDLFEYLRGRVAGVQVGGNSIEGYSIIMRGSSSLSGNSPPLLLLDGFPIAGGIDDIPMSEIDKVEILKGTSAAVYGSRGAAGVIAIYLKKGGSPVAKQDLITRTMTSRIIGFSKYREFYSPKYTPVNISSLEPDRRTTLYWNPNITTENGKAALSFFTADDLAHYRIIVEGISDDGNICLGSARFAVTSRNEISHNNILTPQ